MGRLLALPTIIVKAYDLTCKDYTWLKCHTRDEHSSLIVFRLSHKDKEFYWIDACTSCLPMLGTRNFWNWVIFSSKNTKILQSGKFRYKASFCWQSVERAFTLLTIILKSFDFTGKYYTWLKIHPRDKCSSLLICS